MSRALSLEASLWASETAAGADAPLKGLTVRGTTDDVIGYTTSPTPPKFKITQPPDGEDIMFPVGERIANILVGYIRRCWGRGGFTPPSGTATLRDAPPVSAAFSHDTDPRCVVPYVAEEGGLITHLVRYAMLRMKTYADFCVVCDHPIRYNKGLVVTCGSTLCEHSFHEKGVGYKAVGLEATPSSAPGLKRQPKVPQEVALPPRSKKSI